MGATTRWWYIKEYKNTRIPTCTCSRDMGCIQTTIYRVELWSDMHIRISGSLQGAYMIHRYTIGTYHETFQQQRRATECWQRLSNTIPCLYVINTLGGRDPVVPSYFSGSGPDRRDEPPISTQSEAAWATSHAELSPPPPGASSSMNERDRQVSDAARQTPGTWRGTVTLGGCR